MEASLVTSTFVTAFVIRKPERDVTIDSDPGVQVSAMIMERWRVSLRLEKMSHLIVSFLYTQQTKIKGIT